MVQTLAAAGELQRDLQRELTYDGLRAAEAKGSKGGRRPSVPAAKTGDVRTAYLEGRSIAALARDHGVSRGAIRTAVADLMPDHTIEEDAPRPGAAGRPRHAGQGRRLPPHHRPAARRADRARQGVTVRRGRGYTLRVTAAPAVHRQLLIRYQPLDGGQGVLTVPAQRKARREYENRVSTLTPTGP